MDTARTASARALLLLLLLLLRLGNDVRAASNLNEQCSLVEDCSVDNSQCVDDVCKCIDAFVPSGTTKCLPVATEYGQSCEIDSQCKVLTPNQYIINCSPLTNTCICPQNYHYSEQLCWYSSYLGESCINDNQCKNVTHAVCSNNMCKCEDGFEAEGMDKCIEAFGGWGAACDDVEQCVARMGEGAACDAGACACADGHHYLHGYCWVNTGHGANCSDDAECYEWGESDAYACVDGQCACAEDAEGKRPGSSPLCRRVAREDEECESSLDCYQELVCKDGDSAGSTCQEDIIYSISHVSHYYERDADAGHWLHLGTGSARLSLSKDDSVECGDNEEPTPGGECVCKHGFFRPADEEPCLPELGESCSVTEDQEHNNIMLAVCRRSAKSPVESPTSTTDTSTSDTSTPDTSTPDTSTPDTSTPDTSTSESSTIDSTTSAIEDGVWACVGGYVAGDGNRQCFKSQDYNNPCQIHGQCGHYGGICDDQCQCDLKYVYVPDRLLCWPTSGLNETCISDEVCEVSLAEGVECYFSNPNATEGICLCKEGYHAVGEECRKSGFYLGEDCIESIDCVFAEGDPSVSCTDRICSCSKGYFEVSNTTCNFDLTPKCEYITGAVEEDGECVCEDSDNIIDGSNSKCIQMSFEGYGGACEDSVQCMTRMSQGGVCTDGACACTEGFHYLHGLCWRTRGFGDACSDDAECYAYGETDAYACEDGKCACAVGAEPKRPGDSPLCRRIALENEECESTLDCLGDLTCEKVSLSALDNICKDTSINNSPSIVLGSARRQPQHARLEMLLDEEAVRIACGENEQQTPSRNKCMCSRGYFRPSSSSACMPELGEPCWVDEDIGTPHIEYATCRRSAKFPVPTDTTTSTEETGTPDGVWACLGGFLALYNNRECERTRVINNNCDESLACGYYGGMCNGRSCICEEGFHYVTSELLCWPSKGLNEECENDADCNVATLAGVYCNISKEEEVVVGTCSCSDGYHVIEKDCTKMAYSLNSGCTVKEDCMFALDDPTIACISLRCSCASGYFMFNDTACQVGIGGECDTTSECGNVINTSCVEGSCQCNSGYVRGSTSSCIPVATEYGEECEEDEQCIVLTPGQNVISCDYNSQWEKVCMCPSQQYYYNEACWSAKNLGEYCGYKSECVAENSVCLKNYCSCDYGYVEEGLTCAEGSASSTMVWSLITVTSIALTSHLLSALV